MNTKNTKSRLWRRCSHSHRLSAARKRRAQSPQRRLGRLGPGSAAGTAAPATPPAQRPRVRPAEGRCLRGTRGDGSTRDEQFQETRCLVKFLITVKKEKRGHILQRKRSVKGWKATGMLFSGRSQKERWSYIQKRRDRPWQDVDEHRPVGMSLGVRVWRARLQKPVRRSVGRWQEANGSAAAFQLQNIVQSIHGDVI